MADTGTTVTTPEPLGEERPGSTPETELALKHWARWNARYRLTLTDKEKADLDAQIVALASEDVVPQLD